MKIKLHVETEIEIPDLTLGEIRDFSLDTIEQILEHTRDQLQRFFTHHIYVRYPIKSTKMCSCPTCGIRLTRVQIQSHLANSKQCKQDTSNQRYFISHHWVTKNGEKAALYFELETKLESRVINQKLFAFHFENNQLKAVT